MPSPVGHLLGGAAAYLAATSRDRRSGVVLAVALLGSLFPDLDFVPGILLGDMGAFHHEISHSFAAALAFGGLIFLLVRYLDRTIAVWAATVAALAYGSHVMLDFVTVNEGTRGVSLLWPLSNEAWGVNMHLFGHFHYEDNAALFGVVRWVNVAPMLRELFILGLLVTILLWKEQIWRWCRAISARSAGRRPQEESARDA